MTKIRNLERLKRKLIRLPAVARSMIRMAMEDVAGEIVSMMKNLVAVDDGDLRDSIGWTWGKAPKGALAVASVASPGGDMTITVFAGNAEAYHARWVEFGTAPHANKGKFTGTHHPGTRAQPFFYVSWRASKRGAKRKLRKASRDAAKRVSSSS